MNINIEYTYEDIDFEIENTNIIENVIQKIFNDFDIPVQKLNYTFCSDKYLIEINRKYLNHDTYTDIITFESVHSELPADILISIDRVKENAEKFKISFYSELWRVMFHGVLHLCGVGDKDESEKIEMRKYENKYLKILNQ